MGPDYIDPTLGASIALILFGLYVIVRLVQDRRELVERRRLVQIQMVAAFIAASDAWGTNPHHWPQEVRDGLGVSL